MEPVLTVIHFNDVYDIQTHSDGTMGACNFQYQLSLVRKQFPKAITLFAGDAFSPSILTNIFDGQQMVFALNKLKIDVSCFGNHQFDLQFQQTQKLVKKCNFPWLLGNIRYIQTNQLLGGGQQYVILQKNDKKIGVFGIAGPDWIGILTDDYEGHLYYIDIVQHGRKMVEILRKQKCDFIIALTHMRVPADQKFGNEVQGVDLQIGGHDHIIFEKFLGGKPVIKSNSNFKNYSVIHLYQKTQESIQKGVSQTFDKIQPQNPISKKRKARGISFDYEWTMNTVKAYDKEVLDQQLFEYVQNSMEQYRTYDKIVGYTDVPLQARFPKVRASETNYGNFIADLARAYYGADIAMINSGCIRNDLIIPSGPLRYTTIANIINDLLVVKSIKGSIIQKALQKAISSLPHVYSGSFLLISGMQIQFDFNKEPRLQYVSVGDNPIDPQKDYKVVTSCYLSKGGDGFSMLTNSPYIRDFSLCMDILSLLLKFFKATDIQNVDKQQVQKVKTELNIDQLDNLVEIPLPIIKKKSSWTSSTDRIKNLRKKIMIGADGKTYASISPQQDNRIRNITKPVENLMKEQKVQTGIQSQKNGITDQKTEDVNKLQAIQSLFKNIFKESQYNQRVEKIENIVKEQTMESGQKQAIEQKCEKK